jgi:hypothetical protein
MSEPAQLTWALLQISSDSSDDGGDDGNSDARRTNSKADSSHSTDTVGNTCTGNSRIHRGGNTRSSDNQPQFLPKPARQNAVRERKPIRMPSTQLT